MKLIIVSGPNKGNVFDIRDEGCTIGRAHSNQAVVYDRRVSAHHAVIEPAEEGHAIRDLGSSNGTYVNGVLVTSAPLEPGDMIQLGDTVLAFERLRAPGDGEEAFRVVQDAPEGTSSIRATVSKRDSTTLMGVRAKAADLAELREDRRKLLALYRVNNVINSVHDTRQLLTRVLEEVFDVLDADRGFIVLRDEETGDLMPAAVRRRYASDDAGQVTISRTIARKVIEEGEAVLSADLALDERFSAADSILAQGARSAMCAPLHGRERLQGLVYLDHAGAAGTFSPRDLQLLTAMANQLGIAIENARLGEARLADERFAAIGQAVAGLSHYIKNILGCMQGGAQIVQRGLEGGKVSGLRRGWEIVRRNERKISELVLDMLNYSGAGEPIFEPCHVNEVVEEVAESVGAQAEKHIHVELDLAPDLPEIHADPAALHRCLLNLLSNAIDALPDEGGAIRFGTRFDPEEQAVRVGVADNGCGIEPELLPSIFGVFVSTKGAQGTGLGLAVVNKLLQEHGGHVEVDSEPGKGSTFALVLPVQAEGAGTKPGEQ